MDDLRDDPGYSNYLNCKQGYSMLWESINGAGSWAENPWVWAVAFRRMPPAPALTEEETR